METATETHIPMDEAKKRIRAALKELTGKGWSVTQDRGTAAAWIQIHAYPRHRVNEWDMDEHDQALLHEALDLWNWNLTGGFNLDPRDRTGFIHRLEERAGL